MTLWRRGRAEAVGTGVAGLPAGAIDSPAPGSDVRPGPVLVGGWALTTAGPPDGLILLADDEPIGAPRTGEEREDVAARYPGLPGAERAGWSIEIDMRSVRSRKPVLTLLGRVGDEGWQELAQTAIALEEPTAARDRAVFTIVQNEAVFLPVWLNYYSRHFEASDIYVLDHDSTDGSTEAERGRCQVLGVHRDRSFDHMWLRRVVEDFQSFLLRSYETVVFAEADEFLVPDPTRYRGLREYIERLRGPAACATGYNVVQQPDEGPLDFDRPLLAQRGYWHPSPQYSKRLIARVPLHWGAGFHRESNEPDVAPDQGLSMIHLHRVDYGYCLERHRAASSRPWAEEDRLWNLGWHQRVVEDDEFREWFYDGADLEGSKPEPIPQRFRTAL